MWCSVDSWKLIAIPLPGNVTVDLPLDFARDKPGGRAEHMLCISTSYNIGLYIYFHQERMIYNEQSLDPKDESVPSTGPRPGQTQHEN